MYNLEISFPSSLSFTMKNPCTSVKVKLESHVKNVCLHFRVLLSDRWMTEWILEQEESTGQTGFNLAAQHR